MEPPYFSATGRLQCVGTSGAIPEISQPCTFSAHGAPGFTHSESCLFNEISYQNPIENILFINRCKPRFMFREDVFRVLGPPSGGLSHGRLASFGENNFSLFIERGRDRISSEIPSAISYRRFTGTPYAFLIPASGDMFPKEPVSHSEALNLNYRKVPFQGYKIHFFLLWVYLGCILYLLWLSGHFAVLYHYYLLFVKKKLIHSFHSCSHSTISMSTTTTFLLWTICN